jgi:hypothetical protein
MKNKKDYQEKDFEKEIENYEDVEGLSYKKLKIGLWFVEKRAFFKKIVIILLIIISGISWTYSLYGFAYYFIKGLKNDRQMISEIVSNNIISHDFLADKSPDRLFFGAVNVLKNNNSHDLYIEIKNNDFNFMAEFDYCFFENNGEIECSESFIYPNQGKYIISLNKDLDNINSVNFTINNIRWLRINKHKIPNWDDFLFERTNITISDVDFSPASLSGLSERLDLNVLRFNVKNKTPFNFWELDYNIILYSGNNAVAINRYKHREFMSEQSKEINISWPGNFGKISRVEIIPEIDIMDEDNYIQYDGGEGILK